MMWGPIFWCTADYTITMNSRITASDYADILGNLGHPMVHKLFPNNDAVFQDDNSLIHAAGRVQSWFEEHDEALQRLPWPAKSPELNVTETL